MACVLSLLQLLACLAASGALLAYIIASKRERKRELAGRLAWIDCLDRLTREQCERDARSWRFRTGIADDDDWRALQALLTTPPAVG